MFKSSLIINTEKKNGYTLEVRDRSDINEAKRIYNSNLRVFTINDIESIPYIAKFLISLKKDSDKIKYCFSYISELATLYPKNFYIAMKDKKEIVFKDCYRKKDLLLLAEVQQNLAKEFLKKFNEKIEKLKMLKTLRSNIK